MFKGLQKSLREKKRYVCFEIPSNKIFSYEEVKEAIFNSFKRLWGEKGLAEAGLIFREDFYENNKGFVRVNYKFVNHLISALIFVKEINNEKCAFKVLGVRGTIKKARQTAGLKYTTC